MVEPRFKSEDDMAEAFQRAGYEKLDVLDPDEKIFLRREVIVDGDRKENIDVTIWRSNYKPFVEFFFPQLSRCEGGYRKKKVTVTYAKKKDGMVPASIDYNEACGRMLV